ncbi:MAG: methionine gamma-lyase family protein [Clostridia bacterium]|nr:methionine gamma-lyase family protein [Clostridia bacterium]
MKEFFNISDETLELAKTAESELSGQFNERDEITEYNQNKVLKAFIDNNVSESCFNYTSGYGYDDKGRDTLEKVFAQIMCCEDAIIRHNFVSGTHTITVALFGLLRPNDTLLSVAGMPYDTLRGVIGITEKDGSLMEFGVKYDQVDLNENGGIDYDALEQRLKKEFVKIAYVQRSRGYETRPSLTIAEIEKIAKLVKKVSPKTIVMVDNCYGEYVEKQEPCEVGADIIMGSLIKNPGGGIAPTGGYIAGRRDLIEKCANRLTCPGIGKEVGASLGTSREMYLGVFNAPHVVGEAVKSATFASKIFEMLGYEVTPKSDEKRTDIIQTIVLGEAQKLIGFCQGLQHGMPVEAYVSPEPWDMPGYEDPVIMSSGSFTAGATIELSADGPIRPPYAAWMQGGLNFHSAKTGILLGIEAMKKASLN